MINVCRSHSDLSKYTICSWIFIFLISGVTMLLLLNVWNELLLRDILIETSLINKVFDNSLFYKSSLISLNFGNCFLNKLSSVLDWFWLFDWYLGLFILLLSSIMISGLFYSISVLKSSSPSKLLFLKLIISSLS